MGEAANAWTAMQEYIGRRLAQFTQVYDRVVTRDDLIEAVRLVFPRMGWSMFRLGHHTEWSDYMDGALLLLQVDEPKVIGFRSYYHRLIACAVVLGWVDAPWALDPSPWGPGPIARWPGEHFRDPPPCLPRPDGWA